MCLQRFAPLSGF